MLVFSVKEKLVTLAKEHSTDTESDLLQCPNSAGDVEENTETCALFCTVGYEDYDYVFTAMDFRAMNHIYFQEDQGRLQSLIFIFLIFHHTINIRQILTKGER